MYTFAPFPRFQIGKEIGCADLQTPLDAKDLEFNLGPLKIVRFRLNSALYP